MVDSAEASVKSQKRALMIKSQAKGSRNNAGLRHKSFNHRQATRHQQCVRMKKQ
jgi:hypothetical protein